MTNDYYFFYTDENRHAHTFFCQWHHSSAQINQFLHSSETEHSYQFKATHMKRKSVKSELQRDRRKVSHWEGSGTKSNHLTEFKKLVDNTLRRMVQLLGSSCGEPRVGRDDPYGSFPTQDILRFHEPNPWDRRPDHVPAGLGLLTAALQ